MPDAPTRIIRVGDNAWQSVRSGNLALLVDGENYYQRLEEVLTLARQTIWIVGWDFNPEIRLRPADPASPQLGPLLRSLVDANPALEVRILAWGMGQIYSGKTTRFFRKMEWSSHPRIHLKFDFKHPIRASHHQKIVCVDDVMAFAGGIDLTARRWDDRTHAIDNPLRVCNGKSYEPVHDMQTMVCGAAARMIGDVARRRWRWATGEIFEPVDVPAQPWPEDLAETLSDGEIAIARTEPQHAGRKSHRETLKLTHDALKAARHQIYIEAQYLAAFDVATILAARLREPAGPEVVILVTRSSHGFLEKLMMGRNRDRLIRLLKRADRYDRLRVMFAVVPDGKGGEQEVIVHSKLIVIDDTFIRIGSSNLNNRSKGVDTECDLAFETTSPTERRKIALFRNDLLAEHLDADPKAVDAAVTEGGSVVAVLDRFNIKLRGLRAFPVDAGEGETTALFGTAIVDPKKPYWPLQKWRSGPMTLVRRLRLAISDRYRLWISERPR